MAKSRQELENEVADLTQSLDIAENTIQLLESDEGLAQIRNTAVAFALEAIKNAGGGDVDFTYLVKSANTIADFISNGALPVDPTPDPAPDQETPTRVRRPRAPRIIQSTQEVGTNNPGPETDTIPSEPSPAGEQ